MWQDCYIQNKWHPPDFSYAGWSQLQSPFITNFYIVASTSESISMGSLAALFPPRNRDETLSIAEFSWLIFAFNVCRVFCFQPKKNLVKHFSLIERIILNESNETSHLQAFVIIYRSLGLPKAIFIFIQYGSPYLLGKRSILIRPRFKSKKARMTRNQHQHEGPEDPLCLLVFWGKESCK